MGSGLRFAPELQCSAHSKQTGERCRQPRVPGAAVCHYHGAASPQARAKAQERLRRLSAEGEVAALVAELGDDDAHPHDVLVAAVRRAHTMARVLQLVVGGLAPTREGDADALYGPDHLGDARPHALVVLYERWNGEAGRLSKLALDAGVDEARLRLDEARLDLAAAVIVGTLRRLGVEPEAANVQAALEATYLELEEAGG